MRHPAGFGFRALLVISLAACGSVTSQLNFQAPSGWTATPSLFGRMQLWMKNAGDKRHTQMLMLVRANSSGGDIFDNPQFGMRGMRDVRRGTTTICGKERAPTLSAIGESSNRGESRVEAVSANVGDSAYVAMYIRGMGDPADPQAEAAIHSLCSR